MKPISIAFECFGPYLDRQEVDFSLLEKDGLFLICGETGSGKTTILEAMSYALYGKATGGNRGDLQSMRYEFAPPERKTEVEFIFECNGAVYRFYRAIIPKVRKTRKKKDRPVEEAQPEQVEIIPGEFDLPFESQKRTPDGQWVSTWEGSKKKQNANAAKDVIGLDHDQFCQIVILPQGKFETFLVSDSGAKEEILKSIFRTQRWGNAADAIKTAAKEEKDAVKDQRTVITVGLKQHDCDSCEKLAQSLAASEIMEEEAKKKAEAMKLVYDKKQEEVGLAERIADDYEEFEEKKKKLQQLLSQQEERQKDAQRLEWAEKAEALRPAYHRYEEARKEKEKKEKAYEEAVKVLQAGEKKIQKAQADLETHRQASDQTEEKRKTLDLYKGKRDIYASLETLAKEAEEAKLLMVTARQAAEKSAREFEAGEKTLALATKERQEAYDAWALAQEKYLRGIGSVLAQTGLTEGQPCPVCGSLHHPNPAKPAEDHISDEELKDFEKKRDQKLKKEQTALEALNKKREEKEKTQGDYTVAELNETTARNRYTQAQTRCIPDIPDSAKLEEAIETLSQEIEDYEKEERRLLEEKATAEGEKNAAELAMEKAQEEKTEATALWEQGKTKWQEQCEARGFAHEEDYLAHSMEPEEKNRLTKSYAEYQSDLKNAQQAYEAKEQELEGKEKPDLSALKEELETLLEQYTNLNSTYVGLQTSNINMEKDLNRLQKLEQETKDREEKAKRLEEFGKILLGSHGIGIQRYILGIMLSSVIQEANRILERVCDGRYTIYRTDEGRGRAGLELAVYTYGMGEGRLVKTLSGGEKFLVSLCLAIGLSSVIQARGSGRMEALFVDEGFGSLDKERINEAINILLGIRGKTGMVGIISHVDSLMENIHTKIRVKKGKNGSSLQVEL